MINGSEPVTLSDDDSPSEFQVNLRKEMKKPQLTTSCIETISLGEGTSHPNTNNDNNGITEIIELPDSQEISQARPILHLDKIYNENPLFAEFVEKCLDLENSDGMLRIINKTLVRIYEETDAEYRKSEEFIRVLLKALRRLELDPGRKFSNVKDLVETMKLHRPKKRVKLVTLATNLRDKNDNITKHSSDTLHTNKSPAKRLKPNSTVLDSDDEQREIPTINLDDDDDVLNDVIEVDGKNTDEEKENHVRESNVHFNQESYLVPQVEVELSPSVSVVPVEFVADEIKTIEYKIACLKEKIAFYEESVVDNDSTIGNQYLLCDKYKAQVVQLYKELCTLTGDEPIKRRKVRLQVIEGHPAGPVKILERFINDNIGSDGAPLFPDFCDVVKCVMAANLADHLGWNKQQVLKEANALFTQCGRALQKQRQRREYRDLIAKVKVKTSEYDPADEDPELMRRLEQNRRIALKKENDLLERYVELQQQPKTKPDLPGPSLEVPPDPHTNGDQNSQPSSESSTESSIHTIDDDEDSNFEPPEVNVTQKIPFEVKSDIEVSEMTKSEVVVKEEKIDIVQMLEELGDSYTAVITDIVDPFLVIEISSDEDSSDEDIVVEGESG